MQNMQAEAADIIDELITLIPIGHEMVGPVGKEVDPMQI